MKSQDILLLFKLVSIEQYIWQLIEDLRLDAAVEHRADPWQDWELLEDQTSPDSNRSEAELHQAKHFRLSVRGLAVATGISKSEVSQSLKRSYFAGMAKPDRNQNLPRANIDALLEFVLHGLRYVYPVQPQQFTRGIATGLAAPVLQGQLMTAGELVPVWPDPRGKSKGQAIEPLFKSVPTAVRQDPRLYEYLALADAIRFGQPRERGLASELLEKLLTQHR